MHKPGLYVVATPIGNLEDISFRAVSTLSMADAIAAEDTRHTRILLDRYGIRTPMLALHEHNEEKVTPALLDRIRAGEAIALVKSAPQRSRDVVAGLVIGDGFFEFLEQAVPGR